LNSPQFRHLLLLLGWVGYFLLYFLTENLIPAEECHPVWCKLDDIIPFHELFVIPYVGWYVLIVVSLGYFALYNIENFKGLQTYIMITQAVAMVIYIIWPTRQDLRPTEFPRENVLTWIMGIIYSADTNTGVCPSLHVAYSLGIASVWVKRKESRPVTKALIVVSVVLICLSTMFIKQHSFVDLVAAIPVGLLAEAVVFWWLPATKKM
jgi:membrane-associated phospholipid phosphatase